MSLSFELMPEDELIREVLWLNSSMIVIYKLMPNKRTNRNETINEKKSKPNQIQIGNAVLNCTVFLLRYR